jgi:hypothetical protein
MNLAETWRNCLRMWKWISQREANGLEDIDRLKSQWMKDHHFKGIVNDCFFCNYAAPRNPDDYCSSCPGWFVNKRFQCTRNLYCWFDKPKKFYEKLLQLNAIRKAGR